MSNASTMLNVWTECLGEFYGCAPDLRELKEREPMSVEEVLDLILKIIDENGVEANGVFILGHKHKRLHILIRDGALEISDPNNPNYQNISIQTADLEKCLLDYFALIPDEEHPVRSSNVILLEYVIALVTGAGLIGAILFTVDFITADSQFFEPPEIVEIENPGESQLHLDRLSGLYLTQLEIGETLIEIQSTGEWGFYDVERGEGRNFLLEQVNYGLCRPVTEREKLAILTDIGYIFYPSQVGELVFQDRTYVRTGRSRLDLPFVSFPE